jgi:hypothetical protein
MALAEHLGLSSGDADYWAFLEKTRGAPVGEGLELWQAAALKADADGQGRSAEADEGAKVAKRPELAESAPAGSEGPQDAS